MSDLLTLQQRFQSYVLGQTGSTPENVASDTTATAAERLHIYAEGMRLRFLEVLSSDYPGVQTLLGDSRFAELSNDYAAAHPSQHPSIRWYGRHLATFLNDNSPWCETPVLAAMATFEWTKGEVTDAADSSVVELEDIAAVSPELWAAMTPVLIEAMRLVHLCWNVVPIWTASQADESLPQIQMFSSAQPWLVWRQGVQIHWRSIDPDEEWALGLCQQNKSFGDMCDGLAARVGISEAPMRAAGLLKQWTSDGLLAAWRSPPSS